MEYVDTSAVSEKSTIVIKRRPIYGYVVNAAKELQNEIDSSVEDLKSAFKDGRIHALASNKLEIHCQKCGKQIRTKQFTSVTKIADINVIPFQLVG